MVDELLGRDMLYYTFDDFMRKRYYIKEKLETKDNKYITIYRMYVEARPWMKEYQRGFVWDFLMGYMSDDELIVLYEEYLKKRGDYYA